MFLRQSAEIFARRNLIVQPVALCVRRLYFFWRSFLRQRQQDMTNPSAIIGPIVLRIQLVVSFDVFIGDIDFLSHLTIDQLTFLQLGSD